MTDVEREFGYHPKWHAILFVGGFFVLCAVIYAYKASGNDADNLRVLYWPLCGLSVLGAVLPTVSAVQRLFFRRRVAFTPTALLVPKSWWSSKETAIDYRAITGLLTSRRMGNRYLYVTHTGGKLRIAEALLPSRAAFDEVCALLTTRAPAPQPTGRTA
jgi:hypothetical protein